jgi:Ca2+-binding RTX toxin-like protein
MTTHTWKSNANGFVLDSTDYTDGQAFVAGDMLVVHSGVLNAAGSKGQVGTLASGSYVFDVSGVNATFYLTSIDLDAASVLQESGGGPLVMSVTDQFINDGLLDVGMSSAAGSLTMRLYADGQTVGVVNNGRIVVQSGSNLAIEPELGTANVLNSAGATITVQDGSSAEWSSGLFTSNNTFRNDGLLLVSGMSGGGSAIEVSTTYSGTGTVLVSGAAGALASNTFAQFDGAATGTFGVTSGELKFGYGHAIQGAINFYDNNGLLVVQDGADGSTASFAPLGATINGFQAGDQILLDGYAKTKSYNYDQASHTLKLYSDAGDQGSVLAQLTLAGSYTTGDFTLTPVDVSNTVAGASVIGLYSVVISTTSTRNAETAPALPPPSPQPPAPGSPQPSPPAGGSPGTPPPASASVINSIAAGDVVTAGAGNVTVYASGSSATVNGGSGNLTFVAGSGSYSAGGGAGTDILYGGAGADMLTGGGSANSIIVAGSGNTSLVGGAGGAALMFGGTAASTFTGSTGGADTLIGGAGANVFNTSNGDVVFGGPIGPNVVNAGQGSTLLVEGTGATRVNVAGGSVTAFAGTGTDTYAIAKGAGGGASIIGFKAGDHLTLTGGFTAADASAALRSASTGSFGTALRFADGTQVTLFGASLGVSQIGVG